MFARNVKVYDVAYLNSLYGEGRLVLRPDYQRNSVWPSSARSYLIDTMLRGRPIPLLFFQPIASVQSGMPGFAVVDGQQRLLAIFDYLADRFALTGPDVSNNKGLRYSTLDLRSRQAILTYGLAIEELVGYSQKDITDVFVRLNRYGVRLSPQELRHARESGVFKKVVEELANWPFWISQGVLTDAKVARMRAQELAAELLILLITGTPQDKKASVDLYYAAYSRRFPLRRELEARLKSQLSWVEAALEPYPRSRFRKPVDLYSLVGALNRFASTGRGRLPDPKTSGLRLAQFEGDTRRPEPIGDAARYVVAASRQTDNLTPRLTRQEILVHILPDQAR